MSDINKKSTALEPITEDSYEEPKFHVIKCTNVDPNNLNPRNYSECEYMAIMQHREVLERENRLLKINIAIANKKKEKETNKDRGAANTLDGVKKSSSAPKLQRGRIVKPVVQRSLSPLAMLSRNKQHSSVSVRQ